MCVTDLDISDGLSISDGKGKGYQRELPKNNLKCFGSTHLKSMCLKMCPGGAEVMTQLLRAYTVFTRVEFIPQQPCQTAHFCLQLQPQRDLMSSASSHMHLSTEHAIYMIIHKIHLLVKAGNIKK